MGRWVVGEVVMIITIKKWKGRENKIKRREGAKKIQKSIVPKVKMGIGSAAFLSYLNKWDVGVRKAPERFGA